MKNILIAYYSRAGENYMAEGIRSIKVGNTKIVANFIKEITEGDLFEIESDRVYSEKYNVCIKEAQDDLISLRKMNILNIPKDIDDYEVIYLGFPNYWGSMPMQVYWFLKSINTNGKIIYPFCTSEGSGFANSLSEIASLCPKAIIKAGLALRGSDASISKDKVQNWIVENK